ncbi:15354_t:CDS:2, partial [Dentiscutata heterogama]
MCESNPLLNESISLQDLLMCESDINDIMTMVNTNLSTAQSFTMTSPEFEPQIQTMLVNNNTKNSSYSQSGDLSLNNFQYPVPSSDMPREPFLYSPNSANIGSSEPLFYSPTSNEISTENNSFPNNLSPLTHTLFQDLNVSPNNSALANFGNYSSSMEDIFVTHDTPLSPESNLDSRNIRSENGRKRASTEYDTISFDESLKKKSKGPLASNTRSKSPVIDINTIKTILASLYDTTNRT